MQSSAYLKNTVEQRKYQIFRVRHFTVSRKNMNLFWIWWQQSVLEELGQQQQKAGKVSGAKMQQMEEHFVTN